MRGAQYDFNGDKARQRGRGGRDAVKFSLRLAVFLAALFLAVLYWPNDWLNDWLNDWPNNWIEGLIGFLEWLRYR